MVLAQQRQLDYLERPNLKAIIIGGESSGGWRAGICVKQEVSGSPNFPESLSSLPDFLDEAERWAVRMGLTSPLSTRARDEVWPQARDVIHLPPGIQVD